MSTSSPVRTHCAQCQAPFTPTEAVVTCNTCGAALHQGCWSAGQPCPTPGCPGSPVQAAPITHSLPPPPPLPHMAANIVGMPPQPAMMQMEDDRTLIVPNGTTLPPVCIITGLQHDLVKRKRSVSWAPPWTYIFILVGLIVFIIVHLCVQKTGKIEVYLNREYAHKRTLHILGNWLLVPAGIIGAVAAFSNEYVGLGFLLLLATLVVPAVIYIIYIQLFTAVKIENNLLYLRFRKPEQAEAIYNAFYAGKG